MFCVRKRNISERRFFYAHKTCVFIDTMYLKYFINRPYYLNPFCPKFISNLRVFKKKFELSRFYCTKISYAGTYFAFAVNFLAHMSQRVTR